MTPSAATRLESLVAVSFPFSRSQAVADTISLWFASNAVGGERIKERNRERKKRKRKRKKN
jgi:hypothetical protein